MNIVNTNLFDIEYIDPAEADFYFGIILFIIVTIIFIMININKIRIKYYEYKINKPSKNQLKRQKEWKRKLNTKNKIDPEMFSNEPLDYEKAKNMKYKGYTQAQWDELKK